MSSPRAPSLAASLVPSSLARGLGRGSRLAGPLSRQRAGELLPEACVVPRLVFSRSCPCYTGKQCRGPATDSGSCWACPGQRPLLSSGVSPLARNVPAHS